MATCGANSTGWLRQYHTIKVRDLDHVAPVAAALQASLPVTWQHRDRAR